MGPSRQMMERQGIVRVREEVQVELPWHRYTASWQPTPDASAEAFYIEDGPGWNDIEEAIKWARRHAPTVYVRLGQGLSEVYNAGERDGHTQRATERWPGARPDHAGDAHPDFGGVAYVDEEHLVFVPTGRFSAVWGSTSGEWLEGADDLFEDVEAAVDWGRERALVVLVAELPLSWGFVPTYEIRSAGDEDPPGDALERMRPRPGRETMEWSFETQETGTDMDPKAFSRQLEAALRKDRAVSDPVCRVLEEQPGFSSRPVVAAAQRADGTDLAQPPPIRGWVDISFRVSAPTRKRAFELALAALHRTSGTEGEIGYSLFIGNFTLHAISQRPVSPGCLDSGNRRKHVLVRLSLRRTRTPRVAQMVSGSGLRLGARARSRRLAPSGAATIWRSASKPTSRLHPSSRSTTRSRSPT